MVTAHAPVHVIHHRPGAAARFGYLVAIALNAVMLWATNQLLGWGWPGFLTDDFDQLLPLVSASFVAAIIVNSWYLHDDGPPFRALGDLIGAAFGLAVSIQTWRVFPFDFSGYDRDWTGLVKVLLVLAMIGTAIGVVAGVVRLAVTRK
jgi:hypothetical protein